MKVITTTIEGQYSVIVDQNADGLFTVTYGREVVRGLNYGDACHEYGKCVFHAAACAGLIDNVDQEG